MGSTASIPPRRRRVMSALEDRSCDDFVERALAYRRVRTMFAGRWTRGQLVAFHTAHKLTLMAHSPVAYQRLGRLVAHSEHMAPGELAARYIAAFMDALRIAVTPGRHVNVLRHVLGYFRATLDAAGRAELSGLIDRYAAGQVPLTAPVSLVNHHVRRLNVAYLAGQVYLRRPARWQPVQSYTTAG